MTALNWTPLIRLLRTSLELVSGMFFHLEKWPNAPNGVEPVSVVTMITGENLDGMMVLWCLEMELTLLPTIRNQRMLVVVVMKKSQVLTVTYFGVFCTIVIFYFRRHHRGFSAFLAAFLVTATSIWITHWRGVEGEKRRRYQGSNLG